MRDRQGGPPAPRRVVLVGVLAIFGGEALCLAGPIRYERAVHLICHAVFYAGIALVLLGAVLHYRRTP